MSGNKGKSSQSKDPKKNIVSPPVEEKPDWKPVGRKKLRALYGGVVRSSGPRQCGDWEIQEWQRNPRQILQEYLQKQKRPKAEFSRVKATKYNPLYRDPGDESDEDDEDDDDDDEKKEDNEEIEPPRKFRYKVIIPDVKRADKNLIYETHEAYGSDKQAIEMAAMLALSQLTPGLFYESKLPSPFKERWLTLGPKSTVPAVTMASEFASANEKKKREEAIRIKRVQKQREQEERFRAQLERYTVLPMSDTLRNCVQDVLRHTHSLMIAQQQQTTGFKAVVDVKKDLRCFSGIGDSVSVIRQFIEQKLVSMGFGSNDAVEASLFAVNYIMLYGNVDPIYSQQNLLGTGGKHVGGVHLNAKQTLLQLSQSITKSKTSNISNSTDNSRLNPLHNEVVFNPSSTSSSQRLINLCLHHLILSLPDHRLPASLDPRGRSLLITNYEALQIQSSSLGEAKILLKVLGDDRLTIPLSILKQTYDSATGVGPERMYNTINNIFKELYVSVADIAYGDVNIKIEEDQVDDEFLISIENDEETLNNTTTNTSSTFSSQISLALPSPTPHPPSPLVPSSYTPFPSHSPLPSSHIPTLLNSISGCVWREEVDVLTSVLDEYLTLVHSQEGKPTHLKLKLGRYFQRSNPSLSTNSQDVVLVVDLILPSHLSYPRNLPAVVVSDENNILTPQKKLQMSTVLMQHLLMVILSGNSSVSTLNNTSSLDNTVFGTYNLAPVLVNKTKLCLPQSVSPDAAHYTGLLWQSLEYIQREWDSIMMQPLLLTLPPSWTNATSTLTNSSTNTNSPSSSNNTSVNSTNTSGEGVVVLTAADAVSALKKVFTNSNSLQTEMQSYVELVYGSNNKPTNHSSLSNLASMVKSKSRNSNPFHRYIIHDKEVFNSRHLALYQQKLETPEYKKFLEIRMSLPSMQQQDDVLSLINNNQVVLVSMETGAGKSTQVGQMLLDQATLANNLADTMIICTQPRKISAIGLCERVAAERCEKPGDVIGYQVRLDNCVSENTRLTFCTVGVLLRQLVSCCADDEPLKGVSHLIIDEVHERSVDIDFLLLIVKFIVKKRKDLKVILMSATVDSKLFCDYFTHDFGEEDKSGKSKEKDDKKSDKKKGKDKDVEKDKKKDDKKKEDKNKDKEKDKTSKSKDKDKEKEKEKDKSKDKKKIDKDEGKDGKKDKKDKEKKTKSKVSSFDSLEIDLSGGFASFNLDSLDVGSTKKNKEEKTEQLLEKSQKQDTKSNKNDVKSKSLKTDSKSKPTSGHCSSLYPLPSSVPVLTVPGRTFPVTTHYLPEILHLTKYTPASRVLPDSDEKTEALIRLQLLDKRARENTDALKMNVSSEVYEQCLGMSLNQPIDYGLLEATVWHICNTYPLIEGRRGGAILVFLPGAGEISFLKEKLTASARNGYSSVINQPCPSSTEVNILPLHGGLPAHEQKLVFSSMKTGVRKIVLTTNIAETSITVDDCEYVVDSGRVKETQVDPIRRMSKLVDSICSRASCDQRKGRAGRVRSGHCFRLFSPLHWENMASHTIPEIQRVLLDNVCLMVKAMKLDSLLHSLESSSSPSLSPIHQVLSCCIQPPLELNITGALSDLRSLQAVDSHNDLTPLGSLLSQLPVGNSRIGKLLIFGTLFRCTTPITVIAAMLSEKSPFLSPFEQRDAAEKAKQFFVVPYSDHLTLWRLYTVYIAEKKKLGKWKIRDWCRDNFISHTVMAGVEETSHQYMQSLISMGLVSKPTHSQRKNKLSPLFSYDLYSRTYPVINAAISAGLYPNIVKVRAPADIYVKTAHGMMAVAPHSSQLAYYTRIPQDKVVPLEDLTLDDETESTDANDDKLNSEEFTDGKEVTKKTKSTDVAVYSPPTTGRVFVHPRSVNFSNRSYHYPWLSYLQLQQTKKPYINDASMSSVYALALLAGEGVLEYGGNVFTVDEWMKFRPQGGSVALLVGLLRGHFNSLLKYIIAHPDRQELLLSPLMRVVILLISTSGF